MSRNMIMGIIATVILVGVIGLGVWESNQGYKDSSSTKNDSAIQINRDTTYKDIVFNDDKINIYFFWGDGCGYCAKEFQFWENIQEEYGELYNLYPLEIWGNERHSELLDEVADALNEEINGVPFTIIGDETFSGFTTSMENNMIEAIKTASAEHKQDTTVDQIIRKAIE